MYLEVTVVLYLERANMAVSEGHYLFHQLCLGLENEAWHADPTRLLYAALTVCSGTARTGFSYFVMIIRLDLLDT